jgi:hypothetical protein
VCVRERESGCGCGWVGGWMCECVCWWVGGDMCVYMFVCVDVLGECLVE